MSSSPTAAGPRRRGTARRHGPPPVDSRAQHLGWLSMVDVTGPFLTLPVLRQVWPTLDALEPQMRDGLRAAHAAWRVDPADTATVRAWIEYVLRELLGWGDDMEADSPDLDRLAVRVAEHETTLVPSFVLVEPGEEVKPDACRLLGLLCPPGTTPTTRVRGDDPWAATPVDRLAHLCRVHGVELGLATDGRWWTLVWAPRGGVTTAATFDAVTWPEHADRDLVRAFRSLLGRRRFFAVPDDEILVPLLRRSLDSQEEVTEALGTQVRRAVELLVDAFGRYDARARERGVSVLDGVPAQDVYRGAVAVMMRVVFLLFAEERSLLPADNELYTQAYSAGRLCDELDQAARDGSEEDLEHSSAGWLRLLALFGAVHHGVEHPRLSMPAYDGSIFDPAGFPWLGETRVDDRTVLHMLRAVQYVEIGQELRRLSFRALDVEQIGYVYEGLLSYEGRRAADTVVGLIGKPGLEEEVTLRDLEAHAAAAPTVDALAARLAETYKDSKPGTPAALAKKLAPLPEGERAEALRKLLAATGGDLKVAERLLPFVGVIRTDLRGLPVVITQDSLYVTESRLRKNTGTHYTPRFLAEQVVEGALEPMVYSPGPLQTADNSAWKPRSSAEILALKVADIAMGSGAFLVAACRYLADKLIDAWAREGDERAWRLRNVEYAADGSAPVDAEADELTIDARRQVIVHCLYGADINPMAVEMAKLSLWLVSMDSKRPFTFLDDRLVTGDSLLGITSLEQLEYMHLDPQVGRELHEGTLLDFTAGVRSLVAELATERQEVANLPGDTLDELAEKRRLLEIVEAKTARASLFADLVVGAALAGAGRGDRALQANALLAADTARRFATHHLDADSNIETPRERAQHWLATDRPTGGFAREPLHWPLVFPEVFEKGGFDAIIGNPPFLGGPKLTGVLGNAYREHVVASIGRGVRGGADLVAYFALRAHGLVNDAGHTGLIATNTLAQAETRRVGLDQIVASGVEIRQAQKSDPWPSKSAALYYCAVWTTRSPIAAEASAKLDGVPVYRITPSLDAASRVSGNPKRLAANRNVSFIGSYILGMGFTMTPEEAQMLLAKDRRNADVLFPYLNGEDLNQRPDCSPRRWVINFHDWPQERAADYVECFDQVVRLVRPERIVNEYSASARLRWWQFERRRPELAAATQGLERVTAITRHSKAVMPAMVPNGQVIGEAVVVFANEDLAMLALLSSSPHYWWAITRGSTIKGDLRYIPSDVFETLARPRLTEEMRGLGERLDSYRRELMLARQAGLTATYNLLHNPDCKDSDIVELRAIHTAIDEAVVRAYGWNDLLGAGLDQGFHDTRQGVRYTVGPTARQEILDRLLELNHERYAAEVAAGQHDKKRQARKSTQEGLF